MSKLYCIIAALSLLLSAAYASAEMIHACAKEGSGQLRLVDGPDDCKQKENPVSWHNGEPAVASIPVIVATTSDVPTDDSNRTFVLASSHCPEGMVATGGGFRINGNGVYLKASQPIRASVDDFTANGWHAVFAYMPTVPPLPEGLSTEVTVFAMCVWED